MLNIFTKLAQMVKNLSVMQETWVQSLDKEDPLEKGMTIHSSVPAWRISRTEEPGMLQSMGRKELNTTEVTVHDTHSLLTLGQMD